MTEPSTIAIETRLRRIERINRSLLMAVTVTSIAWIATALGFARTSHWISDPLKQDVLEAQRIIIKDPSGQIRALIGENESVFGAEPVYGLKIYGKDGEATLTAWNLNLQHDKYSANFSPISVEMGEHKMKVSELMKRASRLSGRNPTATPSKQEQAEWDKFGDDFDPIRKFYLNMAGPYLEFKKGRDQGGSGAGEVKVGVSPYPSIALRSLEDKTSFSLSALKGTAGISIRDNQGNKRAALNVDSAEGAAMNLYDKDGKTVRATFGNVILQTLRTGGVQHRAASSLVLFDKDGNVMWSTPLN